MQLNKRENTIWSSKKTALRDFRWIGGTNIIIGGLCLSLESARMSGPHQFTALNIPSIWALCKEMLLIPFPLVDDGKTDNRQTQRCKQKQTHSDAALRMSLTHARTLAHKIIRTQKLTYKQTHASYPHPCTKANTNTQIPAQTSKCKSYLHSCSETVKKGQTYAQTYQPLSRKHVTVSDAQQAVQHQQESAQKADNIPLL